MPDPIVADGSAVDIAVRNGAATAARDGFGMILAT